MSYFGFLMNEWESTKQRSTAQRRKKKVSTIATIPAANPPRLTTTMDATTTNRPFLTASEQKGTRQ